MGATVSREHAKLPFGYTHARRDDYIYSPASSSLATRRLRLAHRLLLLKSSDSTSINPLQTHRLQLTENGGYLPDGSIMPTVSGNNNTTNLIYESHWSMEDAESENAEVLSLNSILNQGPEFELQWHAVGQDCDEGFYSYDNINAIASGSGAENAVIIGSESGSNPSPPHSRSSTRESIHDSDDLQSPQELSLHQLPDSETATNPCILSNLGSSKSISATNNLNATSLENIENFSSMTSAIATATASAAIATATPVDVTTLSVPSPTQQGYPVFNDSSCDGCDVGANGSSCCSSDCNNGGSQEDHTHTTEHPERPRIHPSQHLQKHSFRNVSDGLSETEDEDEDNPRAKDRNKMDIIAALGIADTPDDWGATPFSFFNEEPMFHSMSEELRPNMAPRRYTTDGGSYPHKKGSSHWMDDFYEGVVHLPQDFFEAPKQQFMDSDDAQDDEFDQDDDEGEEVEFIQSRKFAKGKRIGASIAGISTATLTSGHSLFNFPVTSGAEVDIAHFTPIPFSDLPSLTNIELCSQKIVKLSSNIRLLTSATCLLLCCNELTSVPMEIGFLRNLTLLDLSKNTLTALPESIRFLTKITDLKLSFNYIETLSPAIGELTKLTTLCLDNNRFTMIPPQIRRLKNLSTLDLDDNPITVLPAEIGQLNYLRRLRLERCPLLTEFSHSPLHSPPSLLELAGRAIVRQGIRVPNILPPHLKSFLRTAQPCSFCSGPYFETSFKRGKMIEKNDIIIPLEYTLCTPHWNTDAERIKLLFGPRAITAPPLPPPKVSSTQMPSNAANNGFKKHSKSESVATLNNLTTPTAASSTIPLLRRQTASPTESTSPGSTSALLGPLDMSTEPSGAYTGSGNDNSNNTSQLRSFKTRMRSMSRGSSGIIISTTASSSCNHNNTRLSSPTALPPPQLSSSSSSGQKSRFSIRRKSRGERQRSASP